MTDLWKQILDNLSFVGVSLAIVVGLALLARLAERFLPEKRKVSPARRVSIIGISAAIAAAVSASEAEKVLIPVSKCHAHIAGVKDQPIGRLLDDALAEIKRLVG